MAEAQSDDLSVTRIIALATLAWYYEEQMNYLLSKHTDTSIIATVYQKRMHVLRELEKVVDIPYINEHPIGGSDA
jgi:heme oxygenase